MRKSREIALLCLLTLLIPSGASSQGAREPSVFDLIRAGSMEMLQTRLRQTPAVVSETSPEGLTPLMYAAYLERAEMVNFLRRNKSSLSFFEACIVGDVATLRAALNRGQSVNLRSPDGFTPMGLAAFFRQQEIVRMLADAGADINAKSTNTQQVGPLHAAVARSDLSIIQLLLLRGADPNLPQQNLVRPLHDAAASGNVPAVAMLLMFGADAKAKTEDGRTAADLARIKGHADLAARLTIWPANP